MFRRVSSVALLALFALAVGVPAGVARAQQAPAGSAPAAAPTATPPTTGTAASSSETPAASTAPPPRPATGYGYSDPKRHATQRPATGGLAVRSGTRPAHPPPPHVTGPVATLPGFQMLGENGSRLFVELTQSVPVEERHAHGVLTYVLKGTRVVLRNNRNILETVHFNTPVTRARLVPSGHDLLFIVDLRANVTPTWKLNPGKDGTSVLVIDFPKGSYVP